MLRTILFSVFALVVQTAMPMEQEEKLLECSIDDFPVYCGDSERREITEHIYGKKFDMNAIFFPLWIENIADYPDNKDLQKLNKRRIYTVYDDIKDAVEGQPITLKLCGEEYRVICKQKVHGHWYSNCDFQEHRNSCLKLFIERARSLDNKKSHESLVAAGVITKSGDHGPNKSPYVVQDEKNN